MLDEPTYIYIYIYIYITIIIIGKKSQTKRKQKGESCKHALREIWKGLRRAYWQLNNGCITAMIRGGKKKGQSSSRPLFFFFNPSFRNWSCVAILPYREKQCRATAAKKKKNTSSPPQSCPSRSFSQYSYSNVVTMTCGQVNLSLFRVFFFTYIPVWTTAMPIRKKNACLSAKKKKTMTHSLPISCSFTATSKRTNKKKEEVKKCMRKKDKH